MLRLAMTTDAETFERVRGPLADRGVDVGHVRAKERSLRVSGGDAEGDGSPGSTSASSTPPG